MTLHVLFTENGIPGWIGPEPREGSEEINLADDIERPVEFLAGHRRQPDGLWVPRDPSPPPTEAEVAAREAELAEQHAAEAREAKLAADRTVKFDGVAFEGIQCSATSADQSGLLAVLTAIQLQKAAFQPTRFEFENGSTLIIHLGNYTAFMAIWLPFRQSFFRVT